MSRPRVLTSAHWWYLAFGIFVLIPVVLGLVFSNSIYAWYVEQFVQPGIEEDLGFRGAVLTIVEPNGSYRWWGITSVRPGGVLDQAGIKPRDVPVGYMHGTQVGFISDLEAARGGAVEIPFRHKSDLAAGKRQERRINIRVPAAKNAG